MEETEVRSAPPERGESDARETLKIISNVCQVLLASPDARARQLGSRLREYAPLIAPERSENGNGKGSGPGRPAGLTEHALLRDHVRKSLGRLRRSEDYLFAVLVLDLDRFHGINEEYGSEAGDAVLEEVRARVRGCLREMDTVGRIAADEFGILLADLNGESDPMRVASRIQHALSSPVEWGSRRIHVSACIGIALGSEDSADADALLRAARKALTRAKSGGRARVQVFDPSVHARSVSRAGVEARIRRGLENEELSLHYQPIVDLAGGQVRSVEALLRWEQPDGENTLPPDVIPVAEETGLIVPLGWWTLETACRQAVAWRERVGERRMPRISVNVSARQFAQPRLDGTLARILERTGLSGRHLDIEITETAVMQDPDAACEALGRVKCLGAQIHLDDFGTGYSSLAHLSRLPIDTVKIDRTFVHAMGDSHQDLEVVRTIVDLARNLGLTVVAEGVETRAQLSHLDELGCDYAQGYLFHPPLGTGGVEEVLCA